MSVENREPSPFSSDFDKARRVPPIVGEAQDDIKYRCEICGQTFTNKADLDEHIKSHEHVQEKVEQEAQPAGVR